MAESRLSRWSRLKSKGGADDREERFVVEEKARTQTAAAEPADEFAALPGGRQVRNFVPAMAPLAPEAEDDDDYFTRGVGHAEPDSEDGDVEATEAEPTETEVREAALQAEFAKLPEDDEDLFAGIDEEELTDEQREIVAELPPLDSLDEKSDFTPFMRDGVPEFLKRRALRVLWRVNPFFNFRDGLNDYDEDFSIVHKVIDELVGNYKVGRGHLSDQELRDMMPEEARRAFGEDEPADEDDTDDTDDTGDGEDEEEIADFTPDEPAGVESDSSEPENAEHTNENSDEFYDNKIKNNKTHEKDMRKTRKES